MNTVEWNKLTAEERNRLVAEKVMGYTPKPCDLEETDGELTIYDDGEAWCSRCHRGNHISTFEHGIMPPPSYMTSMDVAWLLIPKLSEMSHIRQDRFMEALGVDIIGNDWDAIGITFEGLVQLTPEKICLAALKAIGVAVS